MSGLQGYMKALDDTARGAALNTRQPDPERVKQSRGLRIGRPGTNAPNTGQQRHDVNHQTILRDGANAVQDVYDSEYESTIMTDKSRRQVEDSQLESQGQPVAHPSHQDQPYAEVESEEDHESDDGSGYEEEGEREQDPIVAFNHFLTNNPVPVSGGAFDQLSKGSSYPTTTSGRLSEQGDSNKQQRLGQTQGYQNHGGQAQSSRIAQRQQRPETRPKGQQSMQPPAPPAKTTMQQAYANQQSKAAGYGYNQGQPMNRNLPIETFNSVNTLPAGKSSRGKTHPATTKNSSISAPAPQQGHVNSTRSASAGSAGAQSINTVLSQIAVQTSKYIPPVLANITLSEREHELLQQDYDALDDQLKNETYIERPAILSKGDAQKPLPDQLEIVQKLQNKQEKEAYMSSLAVEEWEEAGDWFLGRLGEIMAKMKDARQERRKATKAFSNQISMRHERVQGKKRSISDALAAMGKTGAGVLAAGTPKKARR